MKLIKTEPILCLDPGPLETGVVVFDGLDILYHCKDFDNEKLILELTSRALYKPVGRLGACPGMAIENVQFQGRKYPGKSTFDTAKWVGRFYQAFGPEYSTEISRKAVSIFLTGMNSKKPSVNAALKGLFPPIGGGKDPYKGINSKPGPLFGMSNHTFSALGVGLTYKYAEPGFDFTM